MHALKGKAYAAKMRGGGGKEMLLTTFPPCQVFLLTVFAEISAIEIYCVQVYKNPKK